MNNELKKAFIWKTQDGCDIELSKMTTQHLFFTLRMIWNHSAPVEDRIEPYRRYYFSDYYTDEYVREGVRNMLIELSRRNDLKPYFTRCLNHMKERSTRERKAIHESS